MQVNIWKETIMILETTIADDVIMTVKDNTILLSNKTDKFVATFNIDTESFFIQINNETKIEHQYQDKFLEIYRGTNMYQHNGIEGI
jgi:hypothetical protein